MDKWHGWHTEEILGMSIPNIKSVCRFHIPEDWTTEQRKELEAFIDDYNAKLDRAERIEG